MPDPDWLADAQDVTDEPGWLADATVPEGPVEKRIKLGREETVSVYDDPEEMRLRSEGARVIDRRAIDAAEAPEGAPRVTQLGTTSFEVDPETGEGQGSYDPEGEGTYAVQTVLQRPESVRRRAGVAETRDDSVRIRDYTPFELGAQATEQSMPGLASALRYLDRTPDITYSPGAMAIGAANAVTGGHADELAGVVNAATGPESYEDARDAARRVSSETTGRAPISTTVGSLAGAGGMMALPGLAGLESVRNAGAAARVGAAVGEGAAFGALSGAGTSEADVGTRRFLDDAAEGGVVGGAIAGWLSGVGEAVGAGVRGAAGDADDLLEDASMLRIRGMFGGERPPRRTLRETFGARRGRGERVRRLVAEFRDLGVRNADDAPRIQERAGEALDDIASRVDAAAAAAPQAIREGAPAHAVNADRIAQRIRQHAARLQQDRGVDEAVVGAMEREAQRWEGAAEQGPMTFRRAWQFRQEMGRPQYWTVGPRGEMNPASQYRRDLYSIVRDELDGAVERVSPDLAQQWRQNSRAYSILSPFVEAAEEARFRGIQNRQVSPTDYLGAIAGYTGGGAVGAVSGGIINRVGRAYEHTVKAGAMERLADMVQNNPARLGPWGSVLQRARDRGPGVFSATWYVLSQQHPELQQKAFGEDDAGGYVPADDAAAPAAGVE